MDVTQKSTIELLALAREYLQPNSRKGFDSKQRPEQLEEKMGKMMRRAGLELTESNFGNALTVVGEAMSQLADAKNQLDDNAKAEFLDPLQSLVDKDIKEIKKQREKLHGRRLDYDYRRGKLKQGTKGVTEEQVTQSYEKLEESIQIAGTSMHTCLSNDIEQVAQLSHFVQSLITFHEECAETLRPVMQQLNQKQSSISCAPVQQMANITLKRDLNSAQQRDPFETSTYKSQQPVAPARTPSNAPRKPSARALYDFEPENPGELEFVEGDIIHLTSQIDENWFEGEINGKSGFFPINYVTVLVPIN